MDRIYYCKECNQPIWKPILKVAQESMMIVWNGFAYVPQSASQRYFVECPDCGTDLYLLCNQNSLKEIKRRNKELLSKWIGGEK